MGCALHILGLGELTRVSPVLLLLSYTSLLNLVQVTPDDLLPLPEFKTDFVTSSGTQFSGKSVLDSQTASFHMVRRGFKSNFQLDVVSPQSMVFVTPDIGSLTTSEFYSRLEGQLIYFWFSRASIFSSFRMLWTKHGTETRNSRLSLCLSWLNITLDIAPHSGISFSAAQAHAMNVSLTLHEVFIDPNIVGGYKVLNFTWFESPAPSPAPLVMIPKSPPSAMSYLHKPGDEASGVNHQNLTIIAGICAALLVVAVITVLVIWSGRSVKGIKSLNKEIAKPRSVDSASVESSIPRPTSTRFFAYDELKEATNNFEPACVLGEGGFGRVYKGVLGDGTAVAIKKLSSGGHQGGKEFLVEVEMLSRLHHRNLVKLVGYFNGHSPSRNLLCYELVPNGSLEAWLHGPLGLNCPLDWDTRMKIALDSARGLSYLHEDSQPSVIHRDFKASNILLENNFHAKVSDFGLAKQAPEGRANHLSTRVMGTFGYVAPEYAMTGHLLVKSDVYSYGVVLLELLTGRRPVDMSQPSGQENLVAWARPILRDKDRLEELADPKLKGKYTMKDLMRVCTIAAACVAPEASQRPTMGEVVLSLKMVQRLVEYQDTMPTPSARPNIMQSSAAYESDGASSLFSSEPFSSLSVFDNENISRIVIFSEDLHEGR